MSLLGYGKLQLIRKTLKQNGTLLEASADISSTLQLCVSTECLHFTFTFPLGPHQSLVSFNVPMKRPQNAFLFKKKVCNSV